MLEQHGTTRARAVLAVVAALLALVVRPVGAGAAPPADVATMPATVTETIPVEVQCTSSVPIAFGSWLQDLQVTVTHPASIPFGSLVDVSLAATFTSDTGIPSGGGHWGEVSFVTAASDPAGFAPTFGDPHFDATGPPTAHTIGPVAYHDVDVPGLPGQTSTTSLTGIDIALHIPWRGSSMILSGRCVPVRPVTLLDVPIGAPVAGQSVGDQVVVSVYRPDGTLLYRTAGFTDGNVFSFERGAQNAVHAVSGAGTVPGPAGGRTQFWLTGASRQGPGGAPELPFGPTLSLRVVDPSANVVVESGFVVGQPAGIVQVSATGPGVRTVVGAAIGQARPWTGPFLPGTVPVVIRWQVRDLV